MDNTKLEELMKQDLTVEMQREFFELLKEAHMLLPVTFSDNFMEQIENSKEGDVFENDGHMGFNINYLSDEDGTRAIPLFTSSDIMESTGLKSSVIDIYMSDLADMLKQTDKYSVVAINPFTEYDINMPVDAFTGLFDELEDMLSVILKILKEKSVELDDDYVFYVRGEDNFMMDEASDGIFIPDIPFNASTRRDFHGDMKYLNIILMPKTRKIVYIGNVVDETHYDTIIAPGSEFELVEELDEYTRIWKCVRQPFYD